MFAFLKLQFLKKTRSALTKFSIISSECGKGTTDTHKSLAPETNEQKTTTKKTNKQIVNMNINMVNEAKATNTERQHRQTEN